MFAASPQAAALSACIRASAARALLLATTLAATAAPVLADTQCATPLARYRLETWQQEHGLPADTVYAIAQGRDGMLYVGTEAGLARFDGLQVEHVALGSAGNAVHVPALASSAELLYAGTAGGDIFSIGDGTPVDASAGQFDKPIDVLLVEGSHRLAGLRGGGLVDFSVHPARVLGTTDGLASSRVTALAARTDGGAWVATGGHGVYWYDGERLHRDPRTAGLDALNVEDLVEDRDRQLWIAAREGLVRAGAEGHAWHGPDQGLPVGLMRSLMLDRAGTLWVGTGGNGVARLCDGRFEVLGVDGGLPVGLVEAVFEDAHGDIWLASGGLVRLSRGAALALGPAQGLPDAPTLAILAAADGAMVVGTFGSGAVVVRDGAVTPLVTEGALASPHVLSLAQSPDGTVWVGTRAGVEAVRGGRVVARYGAEEGLPGPASPALLHDGKRLWVGTVGGAATIEDGTLSVIATPAGGFGAHVVHIFRDRSGQVWLGTDGAGLFRAVDGRAQPPPFDVALPSNVVLGMYEAPAGVLWIATGDGLARWDGTRLGTVQVAQGLPESAVQSIMLDGLGHLWLSGVRGVHSAPLAQLEAAAAGAAPRVAFRTFTRRDGMPRSETNGGIQPAVARASDGTLWYPTAAGAAVFDPARAWGARDAPLPVLRSVQVDDGAPAPARGPLSIAPNPHVVRIGYVAPSLQHAHEVAYQYRLGGFDAAWFDAGSAREAVYRQLPPGEFAFEVRARLPGSDWSTPAQLPLSVQPHLLERGWVHALAVLTIAALLLALSLWIRRRRVARRQLRQQQQRLDALGLLAGGIAHDFSAVLARIGVGGETLARAIPPNHPLQAGVGEIVRATEHGTDLVDRLRAFATQDRGTPQQVDLADAVAAMQPMLSRLAPPAVGLEVHTAAAGLVRIDPRHLEQVACSLVAHACGAVGVAGPIRIVVAPGPAASAAAVDGGEAVLSVGNAGPSLDAEERARIFDPFFASDRSTAGLDLAAAYGLVRSAGGRIEVDGKVGEGTTFRVILPARTGTDAAHAGDGARDESSERDAAGATPGNGWRTAGRRLLVLVEDAGSIQAMRDIAASEGFSTRFAEDAADFFAAVPQWQPSHVALGLVLTGTDGIEVLRQLSQMGFGGQVILTSQRGRKVLDAALRSGVERGLAMAAGLERPLRDAEFRAALTGTRPAAGTRPASAAERLLSQKDFEHALANEELLLHFQPKIELVHGRTVAFEALVRWQHPSRGLVFPDAFIPLAEQTGLVDRMTQQVMRMALDWLAALDDPSIGVSINLSARSLNDSQAVAELEAHCRTRGIAPARVTLELTETSAMLDPVEALDTLTRLRLKGFELALDDFGTGFSSMIQLARLPFSQIKVDKSFVMSLTSSPEARKIVESTITLGQSLGLTTVAEGVEDAVALDVLRELGCERAQGYFISRPMAAANARAWMRENGGRIPPAVVPCSR